MIEILDLKKSFKGRTVLNGVSFSVAPDQITFILGRSGMGKSVLLKHIVGILRPDSGEIRVKGQSLSELDETLLSGIRRACGMVFQYPALLDSLTVFENVAFGISDQKNKREITLEKLKQVGLTEKILDYYPAELSYGAQKRVSIARTLATQPEYLLFDEPTTGMDPVITHLLSHLMQSLSRQLKVGCLVVSHDIRCALEIGQRILLLEEGKVIFEGTPMAFRNSSVPLARAFMREASDV